MTDLPPFNARTWEAYTELADKYVFSYELHNVGHCLAIQTGTDYSFGSTYQVWTYLNTQPGCEDLLEVLVERKTCPIQVVLHEILPGWEAIRLFEEQISHKVEIEWDLEFLLDIAEAERVHE